MSHTKHWRPTRTLASRKLALADLLRNASEAELYLFLGRLLRTRVGRGFAIQDDAHAIRLPVLECVAAVMYAGSSSGLKLRALVEGWSWRTIKQRVARSAYRTDGPIAANFVDRHLRRIDSDLADAAIEAWAADFVDRHVRRSDGELSQPL